MSKTTSAISALVAAKKEFTPVHKDKTGPRSTYASLDSVLSSTQPALLNHGLVVTQFIVQGESGQWLETRILHESGDEFPAVCQHPLPPLSDAQKFGSSLTYARRYSYCTVLGITADEDDDAESVSGGNSRGRAVTNINRKAAPGCINAEQIASISAAMKDHGYTSEMKSLFMQKVGINAPKDLPVAKFGEALAIAKDEAWANHFRESEAKTKAANDPAVVAANAIAGNFSGEVVA